MNFVLFFMNILLFCNEGNKLTALKLFLVFLLCYSSLEFFFQNSDPKNSLTHISPPNFSPTHSSPKTFPRRTVPRRAVSRRTLPRMDSSPKEDFPNGQFPEDISSTDSSPKGRFPKDISANGQFPGRKFRQRTVPRMTYPRITCFISGVKK